MERQTLVEFSEIQIHESEKKALGGTFVNLLCEEIVETSYGSIHVTLQGKKGKPAIVTMHDIGQNHTTAFLGFFNYHDMQPLLEHFCIYHVDALGQEEGSAEMSGGYPTSDERVVVLEEVLDQLHVKFFIGFGIGAGADTLCRFGLKHQDKVEGLVLLNCGTSTMGWVEWGYNKVSECVGRSLLILLILLIILILVTLLNYSFVKPHCRCHSQCDFFGCDHTTI